MKRKMFVCVLTLLTCLVSMDFTRLRAQEPLDGRNRILRDDLLENLTGNWKLTRKIRGQRLENTVRVEWVLNHQFLLVHMTDVSNPPKYEAMVFIGYDNASERYVAHWIDVFGGRFSETLGYGSPTGNAIKLVFEYPDGPFHNTFTWSPETRIWVSLMETKDKNGMWTVFAEDTLSRR